MEPCGGVYFFRPLHHPPCYKEIRFRQGACGIHRAHTVQYANWEEKYEIEHQKSTQG